MRRAWNPGTFVSHLGLVLLGFMGGTGCSTYEDRSASMLDHWAQGRVDAALNDVNRHTGPDQTSKDSVVWWLEKGAIERAGGNFADSNRALEQALGRIEDYESKPDIRLSRETVALFSNLANLPYEGYAYDKIMLHTYKALNHLQLGQVDQARVELNRVLARQREAVQDQAQNLEKAQKDLEDSPLGRVDPEVLNRVRVPPPPGQAAVGNLADFVNPFSVWLDGLFFLVYANDGSDWERSLKSFERVAQMVRDSRYAQEDLEMTRRVMAGEPLPAVTYLVFETGRAPKRIQQRIDIPLPFHGVPYFGIALPQLTWSGNNLDQIQASNGISSAPTVLLSSMDAIIHREFEQEMPTIVAKTLTATVFKMGATYGLTQLAREAEGGGSRRSRTYTSGGVGVTAGPGGMGPSYRVSSQTHYEGGGVPLEGIAALVGTVFQLAVNVADLRTWTTLPKEFRYARLATPASGRLDVTLPDGRPVANVQVVPGKMNLVIVKSTSVEAPFWISQMTLN